MSTTEPADGSSSSVVYPTSPTTSHYCVDHTVFLELQYTSPMSKSSPWEIGTLVERIVCIRFCGTTCAGYLCYVVIMPFGYSELQQRTLATLDTPTSLLRTELQKKVTPGTSYIGILFTSQSGLPVLAVSSHDPHKCLFQSLSWHSEPRLSLTSIEKQAAELSPCISLLFIYYFLYYRYFDRRIGERQMPCNRRLSRPTRSVSPRKNPLKQSILSQRWFRSWRGWEES
jgi:hypothetical protein